MWRLGRPLDARRGIARRLTLGRPLDARRGIARRSRLARATPAEELRDVARKRPPREPTPGDATVAALEAENDRLSTRCATLEHKLSDSTISC